MTYIDKQFYLPYTLPLSSLPVGNSGEVYEVCITGDLGRRVKELGFVPGITVKALHRSPLGDPTAYGVLGTVIALRNDDASRIKVRIPGSYSGGK